MFFSNIFNKKKKVKDDFDMEYEEDLEQGLQKNETLPKENGFKENQTESSSSDTGEYEIVEREIHPAKIICPDCGGITLEGLDFCDKCGGELQ